jgi:hypothetical protein
MPDVLPLPETWTRRDLPIVRAALRRADEGEGYIGLDAIQAEVGLDANQMRAGLNALESAFPPYLSTERLFEGEAVEGRVTDVYERARLLFETWPTSDAVIDRLVAAIEALADNESDPAEKSKLKIAADILGGMARNVVVGALAIWLGPKL